VESGVAEALGGSKSECDDDGEEDQFLHSPDPIRTRTDSPVSLSQLLKGTSATAHPWEALKPSDREQIPRAGVR
jgi:hypothetical protein